MSEEKYNTSFVITAERYYDEKTSNIEIEDKFHKVSVTCGKVLSPILLIVCIPLMFVSFYEILENDANIFIDIASCRDFKTLLIIYSVSFLYDIVILFNILFFVYFGKKLRLCVRNIKIILYVIKMFVFGLIAFSLLINFCVGTFEASYKDYYLTTLIFTILIFWHVISIIFFLIMFIIRLYLL